MDPNVAGMSDESTERKGRVHRLLETMVYGAVLVNEFPSVQSAACAAVLPPRTAARLARTISSLGRSALMAACAAGYFQVVEALLAAGADATLADADGNSAMTFADLSIDRRVIDAVLWTSPAIA